MSKVILCLLGCLLFLSCSSDNENTNSPLAGLNYSISSFRLDTPMDFNGDGQFSNDLLIETPLFSPLWLDVFNDCLSINSLRFDAGGIACPFGDLLLEVMEDENEDLIQISICVVLSCEGYTRYTIVDDRIIFSFGNDIVKDGLFLDDTIIITFSEEEISTFEFLQNDGTILTYNGPVTIEYTLE
ncbi:hypothetical protein [Dokdonia pacifica]|uniref:Lipocalin-like domain-containing protein n=1 Tax=Dokdonia pacifica TaxID=1627892 RepID=A0A239AE81_9FLAO|nr:hypothetical protein [Dokdonia pacifica]SNR93967.1 hypothetical protein SAMN06265376_104371 [Dokdonia pacifica]